MSTRAELLASVAAQFPDNTTGLITPAKLREVVADVIDSCLVSETDAGTAGKAVLVAETAAQAREALGANDGGSTPVVRTATSAAVTLTATSAQVQSIVPGAALDVNLPAESGIWGFIILNGGSTYNITVKRAGGTTLTTLAPGDSCFASFDGTSVAAY